jgi:hypothetical protein
MIFLDRLLREGYNRAKLVETALLIFPWAWSFNQMGLRCRIGRIFSEVLTRLKMLMLGENDPRSLLPPPHLAAAFRDSAALEILLAGDFSVDEKIHAPTLFKEYHTPLEVCA